MGKERIICHCKGVSYIDIRRAMVAGARTIDEIKNLTGAGTECGGCIDDIMEILASVCGCMGTSLEDVVAAVKAGAKTSEEVGAVTGAGTKEGCGRCKILIDNIIETGR